MAIKIKHLSYTYFKKTPNETEALHDVSFEIPEGKITTIVGHTGSGKSTLIQTFNGLIAPTSGSIEIAGFEITSNLSLSFFELISSNIFKHVKKHA